MNLRVEKRLPCSQHSHLVAAFLALSGRGLAVQMPLVLLIMPATFLALVRLLPGHA